jgi:hypothetical protein
VALRLTEAEYQALLKRRTGRISANPRPDPAGRPSEDAFAALLDAAVIPYEREYRFAPPRKFRFDFVMLPLVLKLAVEIDGVVHRIDSRWRADREKSNLALANGWRVIRIGSDQVSCSECLELVLRALLQAPIRNS